MIVCDGDIYLFFLFRFFCTLLRTTVICMTQYQRARAVSLLHIAASVRYTWQFMSFWDWWQRLKTIMTVTEAGHLDFWHLTFDLWPQSDISSYCYHITSLLYGFPLVSYEADGQTDGHMESSA